VKPAEFDQHLTRFFLELRRITGTKGAEYSDAEDQLSIFKELSRDLGISPAKVAVVFLSKHLKSIKRALRTGQVLSEPLHGRITDAVLYLILIDAIVAEDALPENAGSIAMVPKEGPLVPGQAVHLPPLVTR
jgi:hypothetical protein